MPAKREVVCGIAHASAYNDQPAAPDEILVCESFNMTGTPKTYEQVNNMTPDNLQINSAGHDCAFDVSGCEPNIRQLGRVLAAMLGGDTINGSDQHSILPGTGASKFLALFQDTKVNIGGVDLPTRVGLGAKIANMSLAISRNSFVKLGFSGGMCAFGAHRAALTAVAPTFPLSWQSLRAGDCKIGLNGASRVSERTFNSLSMSFTREQNLDDNVVLDSDQPNDITEGGRVFEFEITRKLANVHSIAEYDAYMKGQEVGFEIDMIADPDGTPQTFNLIVPSARIIDSYIQPSGTGNDPLMATLKCKAFKKGSQALVAILADDNTTTAWAAA